MKPTLALRALFLGSGFLTVSSPLHAAALHWDGTSTSADADGGDGTWTATDAWDDAATAGANATWTIGSQAVFGGTTAGTVLLDTGITINNAAGPINAINFTKTGYVIDAASAQTITLGNASVISGSGWTFSSNIAFVQGSNNLTVSNAGTVAINGVISGTGLFIKGGGGEIALSGLNTYTGKTNINQGTVTVSTLKDTNASSSLGAPTSAANGTIIVGTGLLGGTLKYTGTGGIDGTTNRVIDLATTASGSVIDQSGTGPLKFTSAFTTTGRGSKTLTLTGSTAGTGEIAGAIVNASSGGTALAATFILGAGTVTLASVDGITPGATITGTGIDPGTTITAIDTGTKTVSLSAPTIAASGAVGSIYNITGVLNLTSLTKSGTGTWTLSGANTFTGAVTIDGGSLVLGGNNRIADGIASFAINGGTFDMAGFAEGVTPAITLANGTITGTSAGYLLARGGYAGTDTNTISERLSVRAGDANSGLFNIISGTTTVSGIIYTDNSTVQGITKTGDGTLSLSNPANAYTGATAITGGTLALDATGSITTSTSLAIAAGATLDTSAQTTYSVPATQPVTFGIDATGSGSSGRMVADGLDISAAVVTLNITGPLDDPAYVLATYTSLTGATFAAPLPTAPPGYELKYDHEGNKIALVQTGGSAYDTWKATNAPSGNPDDDFDGDGVNNAVEFVLGGLATTIDLSKLPAVSTSDGNLLFTFQRMQSSVGAGSIVTIEVGTNLVTWPSPSPYAVPDGDTGGVINPGVTVEAGVPAGFDTVTLRVPQTPELKQFARLKVVITP